MVDSWKERRLGIVQGHEKDNIWNMDERDMFWYALFDQQFGQKKSCAGGKRSKQRVTIESCLSALGKPVVIYIALYLNIGGKTV